MYVYDNSEKPNTKLVSELKQIQGTEHISNNGNMGIAFTLNAAIYRAKKMATLGFLLWIKIAVLKMVTFINLNHGLKLMTQTM